MREEKDLLFCDINPALRDEILRRLRLLRMTAIGSFSATC
jgi:hypothetical protein